MGSDDLFRKRKAKTSNALRRHPARRAPYTKVLLVCEGEKTEPDYFKQLKDHLRLHSANVEICSGRGSDPCSLGKPHRRDRLFAPVSSHKTLNFSVVRAARITVNPSAVNFLASALDNPTPTIRACR